MTTTIAASFWHAKQCWWVWIDAGVGHSLMYKAVMDDFGNLVRVSEVV